MAAVRSSSRPAPGRPPSAWYGDDGIRLTAPLSPAIHLGARRILAVSTRYPRTKAEAARPAVDGYPPPAQVAGVLMNAMFQPDYIGRHQNDRRHQAAKGTAWC